MTPACIKLVSEYNQLVSASNESAPLNPRPRGTTDDPQSIAGELSMADTGPQRPTDRHWWPAVAGLTALWWMQWFIAHSQGLQFFAPVAKTWQLLDTEWLRTDPWSSLWHLHAQPPLLNASVAVLLALGLDPAGPAVHAGFEVLSLLTVMATWRLSVVLGARPWLAFAAAALLLASPGYLLIAHWFFYDLPVTGLLVGVALSAQRSIGGSRRWLVALVVQLALLGWLRSLFHPLWTLVLAVLAWRQLGLPLRVRHQLTIGLLTATALISVPYAKNALVFGTFQASSWGGMSLLRTANAHIPAAQRQALADQGLVSAASVRGPFRPLVDYGMAPGVAAPDRPTQVGSALTAANKTDGQPNFNHFAYLDLSRLMMRDAVSLFAHHPSALLRSQLGAWLAWLRPVGGYPFLAPARQPIENWQSLWSRWVLVESDGAPVALALGTAAALAVLLARLWALRRPATDPVERWLLWVIAWTVLWVAVVGNTMEYGENYRFRAYVDPLLLAVLAAAVGRWSAPIGQASSGEIAK